LKVTVTGAEGMLGKQMVNELYSHGLQVIKFNRQELDITDYYGCYRILREIKPDVIINCAAYTDVDRAEIEQEKALKVNALGARNISLISRGIGAVLVHFSTDYVFDGKKQSPYHIFDQQKPINDYGYSKYMGEKFVFSICPAFFILRTSWLFGESKDNFVHNILSSAEVGDFLTVVDDQIGSPTYVKDLAGATLKIINTPFIGIYHVTNQGWTSWFNFARTICMYAGLNIDIKPVKSIELNKPAKRPLNSRLDSFPLQETIGELLPPWEDALKRFLDLE